MLAFCWHQEACDTRTDFLIPATLLDTLIQVLRVCRERVCTSQRERPRE